MILPNSSAQKVQILGNGALMIRLKYLYPPLFLVLLSIDSTFAQTTLDSTIHTDSTEAIIVKPLHTKDSKVPDSIGISSKKVSKGNPYLLSGLILMGTGLITGSAAEGCASHPSGNISQGCEGILIAASVQFYTGVGLLITGIFKN